MPRRWSPDFRGFGFSRQCRGEALPRGGFSRNPELGGSAAARKLKRNAEKGGGAAGRNPEIPCGKGAAIAAPLGAGFSGCRDFGFSG